MRKMRKDKRLYQPDLSRVDEATLADMRDVYRTIRKNVYNEATKPLSGDFAEHERNKATFKSQVLSICANADVSRFASNDLNTRRELWHHLWSKIRYSGMRASRATKEILSTADLFDNYEWFSDYGWRMPEGHFDKIIDDDDQEVYEDRFYELCGPLSRDYMKKEGRFANRNIIAKRAKIEKTIELAKSFKYFFEQNPASPVIDFVGHGITPNYKNIWSTHRILKRDRHYPSPITALHFLADIGYAVVKPDRVIAGAFFQLGWLHKIANLPPGTTENDVLDIKKRKDTADNIDFTDYAADADYDEDEEEDDTIASADASPKAHRKYNHERIYVPKRVDEPAHLQLNPAVAPTDFRHVSASLCLGESIGHVRWLA